MRTIGRVTYPLSVCCDADLAALSVPMLETQAIEKENVVRIQLINVGFMFTLPLAVLACGGGDSPDDQQTLDTDTVSAQNREQVSPSVAGAWELDKSRLLQENGLSRAAAAPMEFVLDVNDDGEVSGVYALDKIANVTGEARIEDHRIEMTLVMAAEASSTMTFFGDVDEEGITLVDEAFNPPLSIRLKRRNSEVAMDRINQRLRSIASRRATILASSVRMMASDGADLSRTTMSDLVSREYIRSESALIDPWGRKYMLVVPGEKNIDFDIVSYGADGEPGGEGGDADVRAP